MAPRSMIADSAPRLTAMTAPAREDVPAVPSFLELYDTHVRFVWRTARRLGVAPAALDDVVQETFLVVHRKLPEAHALALRAWIYSIAVRVIRNHKRSSKRKSPPGEALSPDEIASEDSPFEQLERTEANETLHAILGTLSDEKREVFVLVELEQLTLPEVAHALDMNVSSVTSRLRLARADFEKGVARCLARDTWRLK